MGRIEEGEGIPRRVFSFLGGPQFFSWPLPRNFNGILSSSPVNWHPF